MTLNAVLSNSLGFLSADALLVYLLTFVVQTGAINIADTFLAVRNRSQGLLRRIAWRLTKKGTVTFSERCERVGIRFRNACISAKCLFDTMVGVLILICCEFIFRLAVRTYLETIYLAFGLSLLGISLKETFRISN